MVMNSNFWKNKKVLLTGHTGFKGSWLSIWLKKLGVELVGFSKDIPTKPSLFEIAKVSEGMTSITGNIEDFTAIQKVLKENKPEIVIHMAAQSLVRKSYEEPINTFATNVMGTVNLLQAVKTTGSTLVLINITSDKCYENKGTEKAFSENSPMGGYDPYSSSKGCAELVTSSFRNSFFNLKEFERHGCSLSSVRSGNVIGGGDWAKDRLIPDIMNSISKRIPTQIRNTRSIRPWQFVLEPLFGYLILAQRMWEEGKEFSEPWNFGPDETDCKSVKWILEKISKELDDGFSWKEDTRDNPHEAEMLKLDCNKAKKRLGWKTKLDVNETIEWTVNWYKEYFKNSDMKEYTENQIDKFMSL
jgi:CDP-glucose 4,6-dehydratase